MTGVQVSPFFSKLYLEKAMATDTKSRKWKKEKVKDKDEKERKIRSSLLILDLKEGKL